MVAPNGSPLPSFLREAKQQVVSRARRDRDGAFWSLSPAYRPHAEIFESSLGFGTAGILLSLLEIHQIEPDKETELLLMDGTKWLVAQLEKRGFQHGFYTGSAGVWYTLAKLESHLSGISPEWRKIMREQLRALSLQDTPAGLANGAAGSLIGTLLIETGDDRKAAEHTLVQCLLAGTKLHANGVFWDFSPTSLRPPIGFLQGNCGIEYALVGLKRYRGKTATELLAGSLQYTDSLFDASNQNWLDYDSATAMKRLDQAAVAARVKKGQFARATKCTPPEDSISWGSGTCGVLLARAFMRTCYADHAIGKHADADCQKALNRLSNLPGADLDHLDSSILHGLSGVILALESCTPDLTESESNVASAIIARSRTILEARALAVDGEDLSLFSGITGVMHTLLPKNENGSLVPIVSPFAGNGKHATITVDDETHLDLTAFIDRRLPLTKSTAKLDSCELPSTMTLQSIREVIGQRTEKIAEMERRAVDYELSIHQTLSEGRFQELFWRELECQMRFSRFYDEGMDDLLLLEHFKLSHTASLLQLDFDPHSGSACATEASNLIVRYATSRGVFEVKVSELQFALLQEFEPGAWTVYAIADVIRRVDSANVTQRQLAELAKNHIRAFVREGYLETSATPKTKKWLKQRSLRKVKKGLFPSKLG